MRRADIYSLVWLTRWLNGRRKRLDELLVVHQANLRSLILEYLEVPLKGIQTIEIIGFKITANFENGGIEFISIVPPETSDYVQLLLFSDDELEGLFDDDQLVHISTGNSLFQEVSSQ